MKTLITCSLLLFITSIYADGITIKTNADADKVAKYTRAKKDTLKEKPFQGIMYVLEIEKHKDDGLYWIMVYRKDVKALFTTNKTSIVDFNKDDLIIIKGTMIGCGAGNKYLLHDVTFKKYVPKKTSTKKTKTPSGRNKYAL